MSHQLSNIVTLYFPLNFNIFLNTFFSPEWVQNQSLMNDTGLFNAAIRNLWQLGGIKNSVGDPTRVHFTRGQGVRTVLPGEFSHWCQDWSCWPGSLAFMMRMKNSSLQRREVVGGLRGGIVMHCCHSTSRGSPVWLFLNTDRTKQAHANCSLSVRSLFEWDFTFIYSPSMMNKQKKIKDFFHILP